MFCLVELYKYENKIHQGKNISPTLSHSTPPVCRSNHCTWFHHKFVWPAVMPHKTHSWRASLLWSASLLIMFWKFIHWIAYINTNPFLWLTSFQLYGIWHWAYQPPWWWTLRFFPVWGYCEWGFPGTFVFKSFSGHRFSFLCKYLGMGSQGLRWHECLTLEEMWQFSEPSTILRWIRENFLFHPHPE